ncbi:hypothetical protein LSUB1_G008860 [Lachnellula subtilissima]|uniref:Uncharacterized protein n=1 Tax=Lachnellula subtilissima TaxID=602034 RepID=A0A8H8U362_9HELO|nr:hypothetical protein LSUB1_G008860 [Lachnellula subtilissima]
MAENPTAVLQDANCNAFVESLHGYFHSTPVLWSPSALEVTAAAITSFLRISSANNRDTLPRCSRRANSKKEKSNLVTWNPSMRVIRWSLLSFDILVQWIYLGKLIFPSMKPEEEITVALNSIRLADMVEIAGIENVIVEHIKNIILENPAPPKKAWPHGRIGNNNMFHVSSQHLESAWKLPDGHPVRKMFAAASVEGYLTCKVPKYYQETREIPGFAEDLLDELNEVLSNLEGDEYRHSIFTEPISGQQFVICKGDA